MLTDLIPLFQVERGRQNQRHLKCARCARQDWRVSSSRSGCQWHFCMVTLALRHAGRRDQWRGSRFLDCPVLKQGLRQRGVVDSVAALFCDDSPDSPKSVHDFACLQSHRQGRRVRGPPSRLDAVDRRLCLRPRRNFATTMISHRKTNAREGRRAGPATVPLSNQSCGQLAMTGSLRCVGCESRSARYSSHLRMVSF